MTKALVILSGGQDSTTCLYWALNKFEKVMAVTFDYGQRHSCEIESATTIAAMAGVECHEIIRVTDLLRSASPLTDHSKTLETYDDFCSMDKTIGDRVELTFVPMRNTFFLTLAANLAVASGCFDLVTGVCQQDNANYPDCTKQFIEKIQSAFNESLGVDSLRIHAPLIDMSKAESIELASSLDGCMDALAWSHTCYAGQFPPCGKCHSCVLRAEGFRQAGVSDPLVNRGKKT